MFNTFFVSEDGAVTVDWVVLTAAIVGLGLTVITSVRSGVSSLAGDISASLTSASVASLGTLGGDGASVVAISDPGPETFIFAPPPEVFYATPILME